MKQRQSIIAIVCLMYATACSSVPATKKTTPEEKARLFVEAANGALIEGDATGALAYLDQAEAIKGDLPELHHSKALAYYSKQDLSQAVASTRRALDILPEYPEANTTLGKLLMDQGKNNEAEFFLRKAANNSRYRDAYKARTALGVMYFKADNLDQAKKEFSIAIKQEPEASCLAYLYRGKVSEKKSNIDGALQDYQRATKKVCGGFAEAHLSIAQVFMKSKRYEEARKKLIEIKQLYPNTEVAEKAVDQMKYLP